MRYCFWLFVILCCLKLSAQAQHTLNGRVFEDKTRVPLGGIKVENTRNKKTTETDIAGRFKIDAALNDVLVLTSFAYHPDTILVTKLSDAEFFMLPRKNLLDEVTVTGQEVAGSFKVYDRDFHNQTMQYSMDEYGNYKGGVTFRIWSNKATQRKQKKLDKLAFKYKWERIIDTAFSLKNLSQILPLKGAELDAFAFTCRPKPELYAGNNFNLLEYVNACYKRFMLLPKDKRRVEELIR